MGRHRPKITVVGLGPAGASYLTGEVRAIMAGAEQTFLRTARHPAAEGLGEFVALDHLYESADSFEEVYDAIVVTLVDAAARHAPDPIVYAVPGSPLVAERTVELLRVDPRVDLTVVPCLSFLDLAWERLGIDPLREGVRLVDAGHFAGQIMGEQGPFLVAQCWSQALLSEIKLSPSFAEEHLVPEVVLLHHLGLVDEQIARVGWWELDRTLAPDHLTSIYIPGLSAAAGTQREMGQLEELVRTLRERCPWDRAQTHGSLMPHLLEESYEVLDALRALDAAESDGLSSHAAATPAGHLQEELGDLLFQIVFHARLAQEEGHFTLADVARGVHDKLVHRHPHVFGGVHAATTQQVLANWEEIKKLEKGRSSVTEGIPTDLPALLLATKLQRKALSVGLSGAGDDRHGVRLRTGVTALERLEVTFKERKAEGAPAEVEAETSRLVGDVLFEVASLSRRLGIDPEQALRARALALRDAVVTFEAEGEGVPIPEGPTH